jgi:hypothetical protein
MAKRKPCPACGRSFQRGSMVWFAARTGLRRTRCCATCVAAGTTLVQDHSADAAQCVHCDARPATCCSVCLASKLSAARKANP